MIPYLFLYTSYLYSSRNIYNQGFLHLCGSNKLHKHNFYLLCCFLYELNSLFHTAILINNELKKLTSMTKILLYIHKIFRLRCLLLHTQSFDIFQAIAVSEKINHHLSYFSIKGHQLLTAKKYIHRINK